MEYYSAMKKEKILIYATIWMVFKNIMLNLANRKEHTICDSLSMKFENRQSRSMVIETELLLAFAGGGTGPDRLGGARDSILRLRTCGSPWSGCEAYGAGICHNRLSSAFNTCAFYCL